MTSGLIISNPYDDKCNTPRYDSVCEHCDQKFSSDTHKGFLHLNEWNCQEESSLKQML